MARGFSIAGAVRCLYCGGNRPWFQCDCRCAVEIREGRRAKPRIIRNVLGEPLVFAWDPDLRLPVIGEEGYENMGSYKAAPEIGAAVVEPPSSVTDFGAERLAPEEPGPDMLALERRRAYQREWLARKRAEAKGGGG